MARVANDREIPPHSVSTWLRIIFFGAVYLIGAIALLSVIMPNYSVLLEIEREVLYGYLMQTGIAVCTTLVWKLFVVNLIGYRLHLCLLDELEDKICPKCKSKVDQPNPLPNGAPGNAPRDSPDDADDGSQPQPPPPPQSTSRKDSEMPPGSQSREKPSTFDSQGRDSPQASGSQDYFQPPPPPQSTRKDSEMPSVSRSLRKKSDQSGISSTDEVGTDTENYQSGDDSQAKGPRKSARNRAATDSSKSSSVNVKLPSSSSEQKKQKSHGKQTPRKQ